MFLEWSSKIVFIRKCNEKKLFETHYSLEKIVCKSQEMVTPPPSPLPDKNNGPFLTSPTFIGSSINLVWGLGL